MGDQLEFFKELSRFKSMCENGDSFDLHQGCIRSINRKPWPISFVYGLFPSDFDKQRGRNRESKANQSGRG